MVQTGHRDIETKHVQTTKCFHSCEDTAFIKGYIYLQIKFPFSPPLESQVKFHIPQNISGASRLNNAAPFLWATEVDGDLFWNIKKQPKINKWNYLFLLNPSLLKFYYPKLIWKEPKAKISPWVAKLKVLARIRLKCLHELDRS